MGMVQIANPQTGAEVIQNFKLVRRRLEIQGANAELIAKNIELSRQVEEMQAELEAGRNTIAKLKIEIANLETAILTTDKPDAPLRQPSVIPPSVVFSIDAIMKATVAHFKISLVDLISHRRTMDVTLPRQIAMYLCQCHTYRSLPQIGKKFGGRDHTTILHAVRKVHRLRRGDPTVESAIHAILSSLAP